MKALRQEAKASHEAKVGRMTKGYADGGFVPPKVGSEDRLPVKNVQGTMTAGKIGGAKAKSRLDRKGFKSGGRVKGGGKTNVTVIVAPAASKDEGANPAMAAGPMPPAPMPPPRPPMMPPPPPPGAAPPGGMPPSGMPIRNMGGRVHRASGGSVKAASIKAGTKVSHTPGKNDLDMISTKPPITKKDGGRIKGYPIDDGAGGGAGRLEKIGKRT